MFQSNKIHNDALASLKKITDSEDPLLNCMQFPFFFF